MSIIKLEKGMCGEIIRYPRKPSTDIVAGTLAMFEDATGQVIPAVEGATNDNIVGIFLENVDNTTPNYTIAELIGIEDVFHGRTYEIEIGAGTFNSNMVGDKFGLDANGKADLATANKDVFIVDRKGAVDSNGNVLTVFVRFSKT